jgi:chemotaxis protein MotA
MLAIIGLLIVTASFMGGYMISGGHLGHLFVFGEYVLILGVATGYVVTACPPPIFKLLISKIIGAFKGSPYKKDAYLDAIKALYELFMIAREQGVVGIEEHVLNPETSSVFSKYPSFLHNHHAVAFMQDALRPLIDGKIKGDQLKSALNDDIDRMHAYHNAPVTVMQKVGDALPGIGIVAAVLGIVITMGSIAGDKAEIGLKVAHALVGTFLGILISYAYMQPLTANIEFMNQDESSYFEVMANVIISFATGSAPAMAAESGRRAIPEDRKPTSSELEEMLKGLKKNG